MLVSTEEIQELPDDNVSSKPEDESSEEESLTGEEPLGAIESDTHVQVFEEPLGAIESDVQVFEGTSQLDKRVSKEVQSTSTNSGKYLQLLFHVIICVYIRTFLSSHVQT